MTDIPDDMKRHARAIADMAFSEADYGTVVDGIVAAILAERKAMREEIGLLREYYEARENIARVGLFDATSAQWDRLNTITEALKNRSIS